jgi:transcriptional regulator GlxA family with amidase domain
MADLALQELIVQITQCQNLKGIEENKLSESNPYFALVVELIQVNLTSKINLKVVAETVGLSMTSLYRLFKKEIGISPVEYIILERIKLAKQLLQDQSMYVKNVSYEAGFEDANYFIRAFKLHEGITPKQYQQLNNQA